MTVGRERPRRSLHVGDFVRTPPGTYHAVRATGAGGSST